VATFLTTIGSKTYNLLRDLLAPTKPSEVKFTELVKTLRDHYEPKPIVIAERFHFHKREQHEGEGGRVQCRAKKNAQSIVRSVRSQKKLFETDLSVALEASRPKKGFWQKKVLRGKRQWKLRWEWKWLKSKPTRSGIHPQMVR